MYYIFILYYTKLFLGNSVLEDNELISGIKLNKLSLNENMWNSVSKTIEDKLQIKNVTSFYQIAKIFSLSSLYKATFFYVERCFAMVVDTPNYLELEFVLVSKILTSCKLKLTSELEVLDAANKWLIYNFQERSKFAKQLLLTVRLPLLSNYTLKYLTNNYSSITEIDECKSIMKAVSLNKDKYYYNKSTLYYTSRYCDQQMFKIIVCGGRDRLWNHVGDAELLNANNLSCGYVIASMIDNRWKPQVVYLKGEVYVFGGYLHDNRIPFVEKYSPSTNAWIKVTDMPDNRRLFCACAFMDKIYILGGCVGWIGSISDMTVYSSCFQFDTKHYQFKKVAQMNEFRQSAASVVFDGRLVISGGWDPHNMLNTVESYDAVADAWTSMPSMIEQRYDHSLVVVNSKLFVIGGFQTVTCEVFDNNSKTFVSLWSSSSIRYNTALSIGSKILIFKQSSVVSYDVDTDKLSEETCRTINISNDYSYVLLPMY